MTRKQQIATRMLLKQGFSLPDAKKIVRRLSRLLEHYTKEEIFDMIDEIADEAGDYGMGGDWWK